MPTLIRGDRLLPATRAEVLSAFGYRWTVENRSRAVAWYGQVNCRPRGRAIETDAAWLKSHAFYVNKDGKLSARRTHAEPADWAPDPLCICCRWSLRPQDHAVPIPGTVTFKCDMCAQARGACCKERWT